MGKRRDIIGQKFNRLLVIKELPRRKVECLCDCGTTVTVWKYHLTGGKTQSCGCLGRERTSARNAKDLVGQVFGDLQVVSRSNKRSADGCIYYNCRCEVCGSVVVRHTYQLRKSFHPSCDNKHDTALITEQRKAINKCLRDNRTQQEWIKVSWKSMIARCTYSGHPHYNRYGGRGITICPEWYDFISFYEWAIENGHENGLTLDRIDPDGDYCPSNCQWLPREVNSGKDKAIMYNIDGEEQPLKVWADRIGSTPHALGEYKRRHGVTGLINRIRKDLNKE